MRKSLDTSEKIMPVALKVITNGWLSVTPTGRGTTAVTRGEAERRLATATTLEDVAADEMLNLFTTIEIVQGSASENVPLIIQLNPVREERGPPEVQRPARLVAEGVKQPAGDDVKAML